MRNPDQILSANTINRGVKAMKREISAKFKKARRDMMERKTKCNECENYATELHHIIAVEDGGTDDIENLMPLCKECHKKNKNSAPTKCSGCHVKK